MKTNLIFFIKSLLLGTIFSAIAGGIFLQIDDMIRGDDYAHRMMPDWLLGLLLGAVCGAIASIIVSLILIAVKKNNLFLSCSISTIVTVVFIFILFFSF